MQFGEQFVFIPTVLYVLKKLNCGFPLCNKTELRYSNFDEDTLDSSIPHDLHEEEATGVPRTLHLMEFDRKTDDHTSAQTPNMLLHPVLTEVEVDNMCSQWTRRDRDRMCQELQPRDSPKDADCGGAEASADDQGGREGGREREREGQRERERGREGERERERVCFRVAVITVGGLGVRVCACVSVGAHTHTHTYTHTHIPALFVRRACSR